MTTAEPAHRSGPRPATEAGDYYLAVGIPQGLMVDPASGDAAGAVRRGGELVSLDRTEYAIWAQLLIPTATRDVLQVAAKYGWGDIGQTLTRLQDLDLAVTIDPSQPMGAALARLRPLPLGVGLGNGKGDPTRFAIQNGALSLPSPVLLDPIGVMFWWEFDGATSLQDAAGRIVSRLPAMSADRAESVAAQLAYGLMASRLLYLDSPLRSEGSQ